MPQTKIVTEPKIRIVGRQEIDWGEVEHLLDEIAEETGQADDATMWDVETEYVAALDALLLAELGGRLCYLAFGKGQHTRGNAKYLSNIIEQEHNSVLEHAVWNLVISGVSRSLTHELIRHRVGLSPSQVSQRYVDESRATFVCPPLYLTDKQLYAEWLDSVESAARDYALLVHLTADKLKARYPDLSKRDLRIKAREAARGVLPNSTETKIAVTINGRALRHLMEMRGSRFAEAEIRRLVVTLAKRMQQEAPALFADVEVKEDEYGIEYLEVGHHKA